MMLVCREGNHQPFFLLFGQVGSDQFELLIFAFIHNFVSNSFLRQEEERRSALGDFVTYAGDEIILDAIIGHLAFRPCDRGGILQYDQLLLLQRFE